MGQYSLLANVTKREYLDPGDLATPLKLYGWCNSRHLGVIPFLLRKSDRLGGGDVTDRGGYVGTWAGSNVVLIGDYDTSGLYEKAVRGYKRISADPQLWQEFRALTGKEQPQFTSAIEGVFKRRR